MIKFESVEKTYPKGVSALTNINLHIKPGEIVSIVGQSGTGKTTLIKLLIAEERPTAGRIVVGDWDITNIRDKEVPFLRRQIGVVFQDFKLLPKKTIYENVAFALEVVGAPRNQIKKIVPQALKIVGLEDKHSRYPNEISGGEQQRAVIARSLVHKPKLLVADEPTGNLDAINASDIIHLLKKINSFGTTILLVTHNKDIVNSLKRRVITLDDGHIVSDQHEGRYTL